MQRQTTGKVSMKTNRFHKKAAAIACLFAIACAGSALAQPSGAPPGNKSPDDNSAQGKSAGYVGGGGAAGQAGTDPATLKRTEEDRLKKNDAQKGGGKRKDWKE
jgi:hypothetical protein